MNLHNFPCPVPRKEYELALDQYLDRACSTAGVTAIATMGSVGAPGLSDIDLIVVTEDDLKLNDSRSLAVNGINRTLFLHGPIVIPVSLIGNLQWIFYASNLELVHGQIDLPDFDDLPESIRRTLAACILVDFCESRMLQYSVTDLHQEADVRAWCTRTWSVTHSAKLAEMYLGIMPEQQISSNLDTVKELRKQWLNSGEINQSHFLSAFEAARIVNEWYFFKGLEYLYPHSIEAQEAEIILGEKHIKFTDNNEKCKTNAIQLSLFGNTLRYWNFQLPARYFQHLSNYGFSDQPVIERRTTDCCNLEIIQNRAQIVREHHQWTNRHARHANSMNGYLGHPSLVSPSTAHRIKSFISRGIIKAIIP